MSPIAAHQFDRREVLLGAGALAFVAAAPSVASASARPFVTSETGALRKVLIHSATAANHANGGIAITTSDPYWQDAVDEVVAQHAQMELQLTSAGVQVVQLEAVLENAFDTAQQCGVHCGRNPALQPQDLHRLSFVRDFATMLPRGLVLCNVADATRAKEQALFRFMVAFGQEFRSYPVLFDAAAAGLCAEGGDFQVLDQETLLVGVGNHTDARIAASLARNTGMDVIAVNIRNADPAKWRRDHDPLRDFFLHLNTSVAQVGPGQVLVLPWLFEAEYTGRTALARRDPLIANFGTIEKYCAHSGMCDATIAGVKLVDYLRTRGMKVSYIGGMDGEGPDRWLAEIARTRVIFPLRERQAANMLAIAPRALLAFNGAERTHTVLREAGVQVCTVAGCEMWRGYGGPHCLTLPLERA
jgi:arginine deiminase